MYRPIEVAQDNYGMPWPIWSADSTPESWPSWRTWDRRAAWNGWRTHWTFA